VSFKFEFNGGVQKRDMHNIEKFFMFFVVGGKEMPLYQMRKNGLVARETEVEPIYTTTNNYAKVFILQKGFGVATRYTSFYMQLLRGSAPDVIIKPFSLDDTGYYFRGKVRFLKKSETLKLLTDDSQSKGFVERSTLLPLETLRKLITIDKSNLKKGVRAIKIKQ